jgi:BirA family transcriptional regulator, biotin operon repressor / biotin---[acetyl-CoA-carboxylase] ligase
VPSFPVLRYDSIDSTNEEARRLVGAGELGPFWIVAKKQTGGRGRLGRSWVSKPGNVYSTLLLRLQTTTKVLPQVGFVCALAVHDAVSSFLPIGTVKAHLKWPNDCLVNGLKLAGILTEHLHAGQSCLAIGCGINVAHSPDDVGYPTGSLARFGAVADVEEVFDRYAAAMERWLLSWDEGRNFADINEAWLSRAIGVSETVTVNQDQRSLEGRFAGLGKDGCLLLETSSDTVKVYSGDLFISSLEALRKGAQ